MPKLSDFKPGEVKVVEGAQEAPLRLSSLSPNEVTIVSQPKTTSQGEAGMRGAAQGASFGLADEAYGIVGAVANPTDSDKPFLDRYRESRDYARGKDAKAKGDQSGTYRTAEVGGGILSSFVPGLGAATAVKSGKVAEAAAKGAAAGSAAGLGYSTADVTKGEVAEAAADTAVGGAIGGVSGAALQAIGNTIGPKALKYFAERRAFKAATGNQGKVYESAAAKGQINERGRQLLDEEIVTFGTSAKDIAKRSSEKQQEVGREIGTLLKEIDDEAPGLVNGEGIANRIREYANTLEGQGNKPLVERLNEYADEYAGMGRLSLSKALKEKNSFQYRDGDPATMALGSKVSNKLKNLITAEMDDAVEAFAHARVLNQADLVEAAQSTGTGSPAAPKSLIAVLREAKQVGDSKASRYKDLRSLYGTTASTVKSAGKLALQQEKNRTLSLTDYLAGGAAGLATMNPIKGAAVAAGNKVLRERGSAAGAVTLDKVADILTGAARGLDQIQLGKEGPSLLQAAKQGNKALAMTIFALSRKQDADENVRAAHMALMQDPEYQRAIDVSGKSAAMARRLGK